MTSPTDLWEDGASGLARFLAANPAVARRFESAAPEELSPADRFFQLLIAEDRGDWERVRRLERGAEVAVYGAPRIAARDAGIALVRERLAAVRGPVLDLACGRGTLLARLVVPPSARRLLAGDISPRILRRARGRLGAGDGVTFVALDGHALPFGDGTLAAVATYAGLANIRDGEALLRELRRVTGRVLAVHEFYDPAERRTAEAAAALGIADLVYRERAEAAFARAGWSIRIDVMARLPAAPTPASALIPGAGIDGIPAAPLELEVCVLEARAGKRVG